MAGRREVRVLIAEGDPRSRVELERTVLSLGADVVGCAPDGYAAIEQTIQLCPDILLISAVLARLDAYAVLSRLREERVESLPSALVMEVRGLSGDIARHHDGSHRVVEKPVTREQLEGVICGPLPEHRLTPRYVTESAIAAFLLRLRVPRRLIGFRCLMAAIGYVVSDAKLGSTLTTELYPAVARKMGTAPNLVERNIRSAIEAAWSAGPIAELYSFFGNTIDAKRGKPTNGEFITRVAEALRLEEK